MRRETITCLYSIAVGLVVLGLCVRFGGEQFLIDKYFKQYNDFPGKNLLNSIKYSGVAMYVCGWLLLAICLSLKHKGNNILKYSIFSTILISIVWVIFEFKEEKFVIQPKLPLISCSILLTSLMALTSLKYKLKDICLIVVASILIILSEYFILPYQRENNIKDGLGLPILILGWIIFFFVFDDTDVVQKTMFEMSDFSDINVPLYK